MTSGRQRTGSPSVAGAVSVVTLAVASIIAVPYTLMWQFASALPFQLEFDARAASALAVSLIALYIGLVFARRALSTINISIPRLIIAGISASTPPLFLLAFAYADISGSTVGPLQTIWQGAFDLVFLAGLLGTLVAVAGFFIAARSAGVSRGVKMVLLGIALLGVIAGVANQNRITLQSARADASDSEYALGADSLEASRFNALVPPAMGLIAGLVLIIGVPHNRGTELDALPA